MENMIAMVMGTVAFTGLFCFARYVLEPFLERKEHEKELARRARAKQIQC